MNSDRIANNYTNTEERNMNGDRLLKQANQLKRAAKLDEAIACYRKAIEINPQFSWAYFYLGEALASQGKADAAVEAYHRAIEINPNSAWFYYNLGEVLAEKKQLDQAMDYYQKAYQISPDLLGGDKKKPRNFRTADPINKEPYSVLFFTAANQPYEHFAPLYIFFTLYHNHNAWVEICLEDSDRFIEENRDCIKFLNEIFPNRFHLRSTNNFTNTLPHSVRFIETPVKYKCDYVYIGDIDILILEENIGKQHIKNIKCNNLPFSNVIRSHTLSNEIPHLTGLHFARWDVQYPLPDVSDLPVLTMNDEQLLYTIMSRKGIMVPESASYRPVHGIHISPHRNPFGIFKDRGEGVRPGWGISPSFLEKFVEITKSREFQELYHKLPIQAKNYLTLMDNITHKNYYQFANFVQKHLAVGK
ncbi:hypothetical protein CYANOKiyG1_77240 [Okeania sp. KiyG1]|nr:hypothetical protein CYANOKiyG1_77240 [Okeania sp. KiyG1]